MTTVIDAGRADSGARSSAAACSRDARRLALEPEADDVLPAAPARSSRRARSGSCEPVQIPSPTAVASMPPPHSTISCSMSAPSEETSTLCSRCARTNAVRDLHARARERLLGAQAEVDLVAERHRERIAARPASCTSPRCGSTGASSRRAARPAAPSRTRTRAARRRARRLRSSRRSQAKPQAPSTSTRTPIPSLSSRRPCSTRPFFVGDGLRAADDGARVGVGGAGAERSVDGGSAEVAHWR